MFYFGPFWGMHFFGWFIWPLVFILIFASRRFGYWGHRRWWYRYGYETPEEILRRRFASGDISKEEYDERMNILKRDNR